MIANDTYIPDLEKDHVLSAVEPRCMKKKEKLSFSAPSLTEQEAEVAKKELIKTGMTAPSYRRILRERNDPPLARQNYFVFYFTPSAGATPDADGCYGVFRMRGTFPTADEAEEYAEDLIRNKDSYHENIVGFVGTDFPLVTDVEKFCRATTEVDLRNIVSSIEKEKIKKIKEADRREKEEIQERQKRLLEDTTDRKEDKKDLSYYTTLRLKRANARNLQEECEKTIKKAGKVLKEVNREINVLDEQFPEFKTQYEKQYERSLDEIGAKPDEKTVKNMK